MPNLIQTHAKSGSSLIGLLALTIGTFGHHRPAHACSLAACTSPVRLFPTSEIPGDSVYFQVLAADPGNLSLETADGTPIPAGFRTLGGDRLFAPEAELPANLQVRLRYTDVCTYGDPRPARVYAFTTVAPFTVVAGEQEVAIVERGLRPGSTFDTVFARIQYWLPGEFYARPHLTNLSASVDGKPFRLNGTNELTLESVCAPVSDPWRMDTCGGYNAAPAGQHTVTFRLNVVGVSPDPDPISITVDTSCVPLVPKVSTTDPTGVVPPTTGPDTSGGCALASGANPTPGLLTLGLAGLVARLVRRRNRGN